jgi:hypothetical protein
MIIGPMDPQKIIHKQWRTSCFLKNPIRGLLLIVSLIHHMFIESLTALTIHNSPR